MILATIIEFLFNGYKLWITKFIFANLFIYQHRVPPREQFTVFSIKFTQKSVLCHLSLQLLALQGSKSIISAVSGYLAGSLIMTLIKTLQ